MSLLGHIAKLIVLGTILVSQIKSAHANTCRDYFLTTSDKIKLQNGSANSDSVQSILELLAKLNVHIWTKNAVADSPNAQMEEDYKKKLVAIIAYIKKNTLMTENEAMNRLNFEIAKLKAILPIDGSRAIFQPIAPGAYMMGEVDYQKYVEITKPFELMATQTTQVIWRKVSQAAKRRFPGQFNALNEDPSKFKGDLNPVEQVSYYDIQLWFEALNELAKADDRIISTLIPGHIKGSIYRLPTEAEWEFVARARGQAKGRYHFGDNQADLKDRAHYYENSVNTTHRVAEKEPLIVDDKKLYDLLGNVWEWTADAFEQTLPGGIDPFNAGNAGSRRVVRGGSWGDNARDLRTSNRNYGDPSNRNGYFGFRVARTAP